MSGGKFSYSNPLSKIADNFKTRAANDGRGGTFTTNAWLSGKNIGVFGGVEWMLPNAKGHRVKVEFDSNNYDKPGLPIEGKRPVEAKTYVNVGYTVPINDLFQINIGYTRGNTFNLLLYSTMVKEHHFQKIHKPKQVENKNNKAIKFAE